MTDEADDVSASVLATAHQLADADLLTVRQATAYVLREVEGVPRQDAADKLGIATTTLDDRLGEARRKIERARETIALVDQLGKDRYPDECSECGTSLGGQWATDDDGDAYCFDCAGV